MIDNYNKLPIGKYLQIIELGKEELDDTQYTISLLSILTDKSEDELLHLPLAEFKGLSAQLAFLHQEVPIAKRQPSRYIFNGRAYTATQSAEKMLTAQYIDFRAYQQGGKENLVQSLSCFIVPEGSEYNDGSYDMAQVHTDIAEGMSVGDACSLCAFFLNGLVRSTAHSLTYSKLMAKMLPKSKEKEAWMKRAEEVAQTLSSLNGVTSTMSQMWQIPYANRGMRYSVNP